MSDLKIFKNNDFGEIRTIMKGNEPWFVGRDIAEILGYSNSSKAVSMHVDHEDKIMEMIPHSQNGNTVTQTALINESGLYSLVLSSKLPKAKKFKKWVTSEVLPTIRKHGMYATDELLDNPDLLIQVATQLKEEKLRRIQAEKVNEINKPKVIFANAVSASHTSILVGDLAKLLNQNGIKIGQNRLFEWLRDNDYLIKRKGTSYNMPTQYSSELSLFEIKETSISHSDGHISVSKTPKVTGKGQLYFVNKFLQEQAEREVACTKEDGY